MTDIEIIEDQNLRVNVNVEFNSSRDVVWRLPVKVKVGDYVAQIDYGISGSRLTGTGELSWELESQVDNPFLFVLGNSGRIINFSQQLPPLPATGTASFQVASPLPFLNVVTPYNQNVDPDDRAFLYNFALDAVDEEGDIIVRGETEVGESGDVYEYTEQFGDGFTSINPGALFFNDQQTLNWSVKGYSGAGSLADVQASYLLSELSRDRDRISGNVDTFDTIALIEGKRVNYISTNFRKGNSKIELVEIVPHDLDAVPEDRRERNTGKPRIGERFDNEDFFPFSRISAIGVLREDIEEEERTSVEVNISIPFNKGTEYFIVNEAELSVLDRQEGIYPINPVTTDSEGNRLSPSDAGYEDGIRQYGPGDVALPIQSTLINAPEGSLIFKGSTQEAIDPDYPDFSFIDDTLEVAEDTLRSSMDLIAQGVNFAKVSADNVNLVSGNILLEGVEGDLDDIADGADFARVAAVQLSATGLVFLEIAIGDLDDISDGSNFARVRATSVSAGEILLVEAIGDLDDLADGTNFQRVSSTQLTAGGIVLLSVASGDLDDIGDGTNFGRVNIINIDASTGRITLVEALGDIDDISDGSTYSRVLATEVSAGHIKIVGPDGQTVIDQGQIFTDEIFASAATITEKLTLGSSGIITNTNSDFAIDTDGFEISRSNLGGYSDGLSVSLPRSYKITDDGFVRGVIYGTEEDIVMSTNNSSRNIYIAAGNLAMVSPDPPERSIFLRSTGEVGFRGKQFDIKIEEASESSTSPSGDTGRIRVNVNGSNRWIKLYS